MNFIKDFFQSFSDNAGAKISDPFLGAFVSSWILCNWHNIAILFLGEGSVPQRIDNFALYLNTTDFFGFNSLFVIPLLLTLVYITIFPWLSYYLKSIQIMPNTKLYKQATQIEIDKSKNLESLNRQKLLADPNKRFLEENLLLQIERRISINKYLAEKARIKAANASTAESLAESQRAATNKILLEEQVKINSAKIEKDKFNSISAMISSAQAANRFPSAYTFMLRLEESLKQDGHRLSIVGLGETIAVVFGYSDFKALLSDEDFNNRVLADVRYMAHDSEKLALDFDRILSNEHLIDKSFDSDSLFDHVLSVLEGLSIKFIDDEQAKEIAEDVANNNSYEIFLGGDLSSLMADSNTTYDEFSVDDLIYIEFDEGYSLRFQGYLNGSHHREDGVPGRQITVWVDIKNKVLLGSNAMGDFKYDSSTGKFSDEYFEEEN